ncbi:hypothetical protein [Curtobacterium sp. MCBD17_040]|uniref:hypothetical protein n=1 Tax=Curtobacterium sp. MCBD17_040 TaxID=2175674 RepID=UPI000DA6FB2B|nr:hypothetical protein [Curtobacterium sp. MCBD17_040]WIB63239.1 hypothetical protein DEI94_13970 [Curtobacterium sp. MCBD17_040]
MRSGRRRPARLTALLVAVIGVLALAVAAGVAVGSARSSHLAADGSSGDRFTPLTRALVFRGDVGTRPVAVPVAGRAGVAPAADAVVVDVRVTAPTDDGWVRVTPAGQDAPVATQRVTAGTTVTGLATVRLVHGRLQVALSDGSASVSVIVSGAYTSAAQGSTYQPVDTTRAFRGTVGTHPVRVPVADGVTVPRGATAVVLEATVVHPTAPGSLRVGPAGRTNRIGVQQFTRGAVAANAVVAQLDDGALSVAVSAGSATVTLDVLGGYARSDSGAVFTPMTAVRAYTGTTTGAATQIQLAGGAGVPGDATAVLVTASLERSGPAGALRVAPYGRDDGGVALAFTAGRAVAGLVPVALRQASVQAVASGGAATLHLDVAGYFTDGSAPSGLGNDVSWPQCHRALPAGQAFAVIGVNDGSGTTTNPCLAAQLAWARDSAGGAGQPRAALYVNTANPGRHVPGGGWPTSNVDPEGARVTSVYGVCTPGSDGVACSYMDGWDIAVRDVVDRGVSHPAAYRWWLDVETGATWRDPATNVAVLDGMTDAFAARGIAVGLYSTGYQWGIISGGTTPNSALASAPSWIATGETPLARAKEACAGPGLVDGGVAMVQYVVGGVASGLDFDWSCR